MKFTLALFLALFAVSALAQVTELPADAIVAEDPAHALPELTEGEQVEEAPKERALYTAAEHEEAHEEAKASITELLASGKSSTACSNLAAAAKKDVTDGVAASQKVIAGMPNGSQCKNEGSSLVTKANGDKTKADKASADALQKLNDAKNAQIDFGKFKVSSLKEGQCGSFFNTQAWKDAKSKISNADKAYTTAKTKASDAAKAVDTAKKESAKLVKKCKCDSKTAIEKAIKDMNAKAKTAHQAAWTKAYHMDCVLAGKAVNSCTVPALPTVQPVKFSADIKDSCSASVAGALKVKEIKENSGGSKDNEPFLLAKFPATTGWSNDKASMDKYINFCVSKGMKAVGCGVIRSDGIWDASKNSKSIAMPSSWGCNMLPNLALSSKGDMGKNIVALQTTIKPGSWLYAYATSRETQPKSNLALSPICGMHKSAAAASSGGSPPPPPLPAGALKVKKINSNSGGSQNNKPFELVKFPATTGWTNERASMDKYINFCASKGMKAVGCGTSHWDASKDSKSIAMPKNWSCNMLNNLALSSRGDMGKNIVALQTTINYNSNTWLYAWTTSYSQPKSNLALSPICGKHL